jgi:hypothetical protein
MRTHIIDAYWGIGMYPAERGPRTELFKRVLGEVQEFPYAGPLSMVSTIPASTLELLVQRQLCLSLSSPIPPQYSLLRLAGSPSSFFTFNLDGLAKAYLSDLHYVFEPHGTIDRIWVNGPDFTNWLEFSLDIRLPEINRKILPGTEPLSVTNDPQYRKARIHLHRAPAVVLLGYSFGAFGGRMDDSESFEYLVEGLTVNKCPVLVVSLSPLETSGILEDRLHRRVDAISLRWDALAHAASCMLQCNRHPFTRWLGHDQLRTIQRAYFDAYDQLAI